MRYLSGLVLFAVLSSALLSAQTAHSGLRQRALSLEQQGNFAGAETAWQGLLHLEPRDAEAVAHVGLDEARQKNYNAAIIDYRKALVLDPHIGGLRLDLALALFKSKRLKEAIPVFADLHRRHPENTRFTILLGMCYYGIGDYAHAVPYLQKVAQQEPNNLSLRLPLAQSCMWTKDYQCVLTVYRQILALNGESAEADMLAGEAWNAKGNTPAAILQFRAAVKADPSEPDVHFGLGYLLWTQQQYTQAENEFRAELVNNPQNGQSRAYLGDTLMHLNQNKEAHQTLEEALKTDPSLEMAYLDLGTIDSEAGQREVALREFKKAVMLDPNDQMAHWKLARLEASMGDSQQARLEFAKVAKLHQESAEKLYMKMAGSPVARAAAKAKEHAQP